MCERNTSWLPLAHPAGDLACNTGTYPDWELNMPPFGSQADTQSTEPHQAGLTVILIYISQMANNVCILVYAYLAFEFLVW